jgi:putative phage-type endonuclease
MKIIQCGGQRTEAWFDWHLGRLTSSRIADAVARRKRNPTEPLQAYLDLRLELAVERITKKPAEHFVSIWMERGIELEPLARAAYELRTDQSVGLVDFVLHEANEQWGASPDGVIGDEGILEIKIPKRETHAEYIYAGCVPAEYLPQCHWLMACTGLKWVDFTSWCPDFPDPLDLFICRLPRDEERIKSMEAEAKKFLQEVEGLVTQLTGGLESLLRKSLVPRAVIPNDPIPLEM